MGQYQQWLQHQELHKRLSSQFEALEAELAQLQVCLDRLAQQHKTVSLTDNRIMQSLVAHWSTQAASTKSNSGNISEKDNPLEPGLDQSGDAISLALQSWGSLPNFEQYEITETFLVDNQASAFFKHPELELLPDDMIAFFEEHEQTDPQLELPWWLRKITVSSKYEKASRPIDHYSIRTNRLVQRWIERWGRQPSPARTSTENNEEDKSE